MDVGHLRKVFASQLAAGLPETAVLSDGTRVEVQRTSMRADFAAAQYGVGSGYACSVLIPYRDGLPGRDGALVLGGRHFVVIGRQDFAGISVRLDLREGV